MRPVPDCTGERRQADQPSVETSRVAPGGAFCCILGWQTLRLCANWLEAHDESGQEGEQQRAATLCNGQQALRTKQTMDLEALRTNMLLRFCFSADHIMREGRRAGVVAEGSVELRHDR